ncbi:hypothetical protein [Embleya hyalina]|uniref:Uncharacterized protein n=1 Tax=Embleya hyalina TaxID=516124 RepID=A0A401YZ86_9ACTN|nr:hypothetical protein [Embleya hyalina]GCD99870.1 hypothetical protein EHYA_07592 [Embleya hyalina]
MPKPTIKSWNAREQVTAEKLNEQLRDTTAFLYQPPYASLWTADNTQTAGGSVTQLSWTDWEFRGVAIQSSAPRAASGILVQEPGLYQIDYAVLAQPVGGISHILTYVRVNGTEVIGSAATAADVGFMSTGRINGVVKLRAGDVVSFAYYFSSGRSGVVIGNGAVKRGTHAYVYYVGES